MRNKKIRLTAKTSSARLGAVMFSTVIGAVIGVLIGFGVLNFGDRLLITIGAIAASLVIIVPVLASNLGAYIYFNLEDGTITLCKNGFKKETYCLECITKLQVEAKTIDLHVASATDEQNIKCGTGCIKQTSYKKVHYKMPSYKNKDQRNRYEQFAKKCNKVLDEVVHKKVIRQVHRLVGEPTAQ